ncbi:MAG: VanZ family protein [Deltaproteobacteria bacterium]
MKRIIFYWLPLALYTGFIVVFSVRPVPEDLPDLPDIDKLYHFIAYFLLGFLWARALDSSALAFAGGNRKKGALAFAAIMAFLFGVLMEVVQYFIPERSAEVVDALANGAGAISGAFVFGYICLRFFKKERQGEAGHDA